MPASQRLLFLSFLLSTTCSLRLERLGCTHARLSSCRASSILRACGGWGELGRLRLRGGGSQNYYKVLGLDKGRDSSAEEIKKAYKKMALKWHPDRAKPNAKVKAEQEFKKVAEAYEVLSDPKKKAYYDRFGDEGVRLGRQGNGPQDGEVGHEHGSGFYAQEVPDFDFTDPFDVFAQFFGADPRFHSSASSRGFQGLGTDMFGRTIYRSGNVEFCVGQPSPINMLFRVLSMAAESWASRSSSRPQEEGEEEEDAAAPPSRCFRLDMPCSLEEILTGCVKNVSGPPNIRKNFQVEVMPGWKEGTKATFVGEEGGRAWEVVVTLTQRPHRHLVRTGNDLHYLVRATPRMLERGFETLLPLLGEEPGRVKIPKTPLSKLNSQEELQIKRIKGKGMPIKGSEERGDLLVRVKLTNNFLLIMHSLGLVHLWGLFLHRSFQLASSFAMTASVAWREHIIDPLLSSRAWHSIKNFFDSPAVKHAILQTLLFIVLLFLNPTYAFLHAFGMIFRMFADSGVQFR